jgi:hypothetical protein
MRLPLDRASQFHQDEGGAITLVVLAGVIVLMFMLWVVMDTGSAARHKVEVQTAADSAAYSQASVKARTMNLVALSNVAKRSIVGVRAVYTSMMDALQMWIGIHAGICLATQNARSCNFVAQNAPLYLNERTNDYRSYGSMLESYYGQDLQALDNHQVYLSELTPWWAWSEAVYRASRNGAAMSGFFPAPGGTFDNPNRWFNLTSQVRTLAGNTAQEMGSGAVDRMPFARGTYEDMLEDGMSTRAYQGEYAYNVSKHARRSDRGADDPSVVASHRLFYSDEVTDGSNDAFGELGQPFVLGPVNHETAWLERTSNVAIVFNKTPDFFGAERSKFDIMSDYGSQHRERMNINGYWAIAKGEVSFQGDGPPDMWHPQWVARVRPINLPGEFSFNGQQMNEIYADVIPYLALSAELTGTGDVDTYMNDLIFMEKATRPMGQSTIEGLGK